MSGIPIARRATRASGAAASTDEPAEAARAGRPPTGARDATASSVSGSRVARSAAPSASTVKGVAAPSTVRQATSTRLRKSSVTEDAAPAAPADVALEMQPHATPGLFDSSSSAQGGVEQEQVAPATQAPASPESPMPFTASADTSSGNMSRLQELRQRRSSAHQRIQARLSLGGAATPQRGTAPREGPSSPAAAAASAADTSARTSQFPSPVTRMHAVTEDPAAALATAAARPVTPPRRVTATKAAASQPAPSAVPATPGAASVVDDDDDARSISTTMSGARPRVSVGLLSTTNRATSRSHAPPLPGSSRLLAPTAASTGRSISRSSAASASSVGSGGARSVSTARAPIASAPVPRAASRSSISGPSAVVASPAPSLVRTSPNATAAPGARSHASALIAAPAAAAPSTSASEPTPPSLPAPIAAITPATPSTPASAAIPSAARKSITGLSAAIGPRRRLSGAPSVPSEPSTAPVGVPDSNPVPEPTTLSSTDAAYDDFTSKVASPPPRPPSATVPSVRAAESAAPSTQPIGSSAVVLAHVVTSVTALAPAGVSTTDTDALIASHKDALRKLRESHAREVQKLKTEHEKEIESLRPGHRGTVETISKVKAEYEELLSRTRAENAKVLAAERALHEAERNKLQSSALRDVQNAEARLQSVQKELEDARRAAGAMAEERAALSASLDIRTEHLSLALEERTREAEQFKTQCTGLRTELEAAQRGISELRDKLAATVQQHGADTAALANERQARQSATTELNAAQGDIERLRASVQHMQQQLDEEIQRRQAAEAKVRDTEEAATGTTVALERSQAALRTELEAAREQLKIADIRKAGMEASLQQSAAVRLELSAKVDALQQQLAVAAQQTDDVRRAATQAQALASTLEARCEELQRNEAESSRQLLAAKQRWDELQTQQAAASTADDAAKRMQLRLVDDLQAERERVALLDKQLKDTQRSLDDLIFRERETSEQAQELRGTVHTLRSAEAELRARVQEYGSASQLWAQREKQFHAEAAEAAVRLTSALQSLDDVRAALQQKDRQLDALQSQCSLAVRTAAETNEQVHAARRLVSQLESERDELRQSLAQAQADTTAVRAAASHATQTSDDQARTWAVRVQDMERQLAEATALRDSAEAAAQDARNALAVADEAVLAANERVSALDRRMVEAVDQVHTLQSQLAEATAQCARLQSAHADDVRTKEESWRLQSQSAEETIRVQSERIAVLQLELDTARIDLETAQLTWQQEMEERQMEYQGQLAAAIAARDAALQRATDAELALAAGKEDSDILRASVEALTAQVSAGVLQPSASAENAPVDTAAAPGSPRRGGGDGVEMHVLLASPGVKTAEVASFRVLKEHNGALRRALAAAQLSATAETEQLAKELADAQRRILHLDREMNVKQERIHSLVRDLDDLSASNRNLSAALQEHEEMRALEDELEAEHERIEQELRSQLETLRGELHTATVSATAAASQPLSSASSMPASYSDAELVGAKMEAERLRQELGSMTSRSVLLQGHVHALQDRCSAGLLIQHDIIAMLPPKLFDAAVDRVRHIALAETLATSTMQLLCTVARLNIEHVGKDSLRVTLLLAMLHRVAWLCAAASARLSEDASLEVHSTSGVALAQVLDVLAERVQEVLPAVSLLLSNADTAALGDCIDRMDDMAVTCARLEGVLQGRHAIALCSTASAWLTAEPPETTEQQAASPIQLAEAASLAGVLGRWLSRSDGADAACAVWTEMAAQTVQQARRERVEVVVLSSETSRSELPLKLLIAGSGASAARGRLLHDILLTAAACAEVAEHGDTESTLERVQPSRAGLSAACAAAVQEWTSVAGMPAASETAQRVADRVTRMWQARSSTNSRDGIWPVSARGAPHPPVCGAARAELCAGLQAAMDVHNLSRTVERLQECVQERDTARAEAANRAAQADSAVSAHASLVTGLRRELADVRERLDDAVREITRAKDTPTQPHPVQPPSSSSTASPASSSSSSSVSVCVPACALTHALKAERLAAARAHAHVHALALARLCRQPSGPGPHSSSHPTPSSTHTDTLQRALDVCRAARAALMA